MEFKAYAKINLALDIMGNREDGYHLLKMIMQTIDLYDIIEINISPSDIKISCNKDNIPLDDSNLAYKAAKIFIDTYKIEQGVEIYIEKNIPVQAGLAGGSADAAAVLKAMRTIFKPEITDEELINIGVKIGADVPYCIFGKTALCEGIGEKITPIKYLKGNIVLLVKPNFGICTKDVYDEFDKKQRNETYYTDKVLKSIRNENFKLAYSDLGNVLENVVLEKFSDVKDIKEIILRFGAINAVMSGSGPSVYGLFDDMLTAQKCYDFMRDKYKEVFITRTI